VTRPLLCLAACLCVAGLARVQESQAPEKQTGAVHVQMRNVHYRFSDGVAVQIYSLNGALVPVGNNEFPIFDDKNSFKIRIDSAEIAISTEDLANLLNSYAFARPNSPLSGISVTASRGQLKVRGRLHDKGNIPFETQGVMLPTPDGRIRLHSEKIKALHVPVKGLLDALGIAVSDLIKSGKVPGVQSEEDDLILDLEQLLPPPHIEGKVTAVRVEGDAIIQAFGAAAASSGVKQQSANYMSYQGNRLRFGRLTMDDADIVLSDLDPGDPLDFYLDHYKEQLAAGYTKITANFQLRVFLRDFNKLGHARSTPSPKSKQD
jgi:hypothetical protein